MTKTTGLVMLGLLCASTASYGGSFDPDRYRAEQEERANEQKLQKKARVLNLKPVDDKLDKVRAMALSVHYGILYSRIMELRRQGMGWGDLTANMAMADRLSTYSPTPIMMDDAFEKIVELTQKGQGWAGITRHYGFSLNPVLNSMKLGEKSINKAERQALKEKSKQVEQTAGAEHEQQMRQFDGKNEWREPQTP